MKHDLDEWLAEAIMSKTPLIIVEGRDDIQFYGVLANIANKEVWIDAIENIEGYAEGCDNVIQCITDLQERINERPQNKDFLMGIIDTDCRRYRQGIPNIKCLFVLKYYSYESHFATRNSLKKLIQLITYASPTLVNEKTLQYIESDVSKQYEDLYYISLEALKKACICGYDAIVGYKTKMGYIFDNNNKSRILQLIYDKKNDLDAFANERSISMADIKCIAKGKWLLHVYCEAILNKILTLHIACSDNKINSCQCCNSGEYGKCLWKTKNNFQFGQVFNLLLSCIDEDEIGYITNRIKQLA